MLYKNTYSQVSICMRSHTHAHRRGHIISYLVPGAELQADGVETVVGGGLGPRWIGGAGAEWGGVMRDQEGDFITGIQDGTSA